jgi:hypothetical protein
VHTVKSYSVYILTHGFVMRAWVVDMMIVKHWAVMLMTPPKLILSTQKKTPKKCISNLVGFPTAQATVLLGSRGAAHPRLRFRAVAPSYNTLANPHQPSKQQTMVLSAHEISQLRAALQDAVVKCSERCLYQSSKWCHPISR